MISSQGCRWFFKKRTHPIWNSILPEPGQPSGQLSKLIRLTACKKTKHTVSRSYRAVCSISHGWSVLTNYGTHKVKRCLNSEPQKLQGTKMYFTLWWILSYDRSYLLMLHISWKMKFERMDINSALHECAWCGYLKCIVLTWTRNVVIIIIFIIKRGQQCKAKREWYTFYQSEDPSPTIPTFRQEEEKEKIVEEYSWEGQLRPIKKHWPCS